MEGFFHSQIADRGTRHAAARGGTARPDKRLQPSDRSSKRKEGLVAMLRHLAGPVITLIACIPHDHTRKDTRLYSTQIAQFVEDFLERLPLSVPDAPVTNTCHVDV